MQQAVDLQAAGSRMSEIPVSQWRGTLVTRKAKEGTPVAKENRMWIVKHVADHLKPRSPFPDPSKAKTYAEYHSRITGYFIDDTQQPLIEVQFCPSVPWRLFHRPKEVK